ncbi:hypothetical protein E2562_031059 [Oryza meyeriana var. granulata]|uniref:Uncharacterized protein n=1 Tax=Oryza meyeriana var. granulata TaxID=110450 RepID=A0A6G1E5L1_9ORYZ|nr:hypothetical protein E2562_031059 [Oryza meyeriana var. granulata]
MAEDIVQNVMAAVEAAVEQVPKKWANLRALHLKAVDSVALPIYQVVPELGMKIEVPVAQLGGEVDSGEVGKVETGAKNVGKKKTLKKKVKGTSAELKISKKGKEKSKRALDKLGEDASVKKKKGRKNDHALEEASNKKKKGKKEASNKKEVIGGGYKVVGPLGADEKPSKPYEPVFAVVQIGSHQFKVSNGDSIFTERLKFCDVNDKLILNRVLMLGSQAQTVIGRPILPDAAVHAVVEEHALDAKVIIFKKKRRKNYRRTKGHRQASVEKNARELKLYIEELYWGSGKQVLLLGHSKGGVDAAAALSLYWSELKGKVAGLALVQSPYGGTPVASDILREGQLADKATRKIVELIICKLIKGDIRALEDLTYVKRRNFISNHKLPVDELPIISFHTEASTAPTMLASLSRVAQAKLLPWLPLPWFLSAPEYSESVLASLKLPVVVPASAAMAISALHLRLRYGDRSDGLVTRRDAEVPGSVVVRPERRLDHAWMVHSTLRKDRTEADATQMCEALMAMLVEIGKKKCC